MGEQVVSGGPARVRGTDLSLTRASASATRICIPRLEGFSCLPSGGRKPDPGRQAKKSVDAGASREPSGTMCLSIIIYTEEAGI